MSELRIAICVIEQDNKYLLQYRNGDSSIGAADLFGCFGGKIEEDETPEQAMVRELSEETNLSINLDELESIGEVRVKSDYKNKPIKVLAYVFHTLVQSIDKVESKEGMLYSIHKDKIQEYYDKMTPATKAVFQSESLISE